MKKGLCTMLLTVIAAAAVFCCAAKAEAASLIISPGQQIIEHKPVDQTDLTMGIVAPTGLEASSNVPGRVVLTWRDNSSNENAFVIERKLAGFNYQQVATVSANATSYEEDELSTFPVHPGETYYYRVRAVNKNAQSDCSNEVSVTVNNDYPVIPPCNLKAETDVSGDVKLTWMDRSNNETKFVLERMKAGGNYQPIVELPPDTTEYLDQSIQLDKGVRYDYRIMAVNNVGAAYATGFAAFWMPSAKPSAPKSFMSLDQTDSSIQLSWKDTADNEAGFRIGRKKTNSSEQFPPYYAPTAAVGPNVTTYTDTGLEPDTEYTYEIDAYNAAGPSTALIINTFTRPKPPILTAKAVSGSEVLLTWSDQTSNKFYKYEIERKKEGEQFFTLLTELSAGEHSYSDKAVTMGKKYYYRISCHSHLMYPSSYSEEVSVIPLNSYQLPQQGTGSHSNITGNAVAAKNVVRLQVGQTSYRVNDEIRQMDTAPVIQEGRTMLPVRYVAEPLGATVAWDALTQKVAVSLSDIVIELQIGNNTALINGQKTMIDPGNPAVAPIISAEGRTLLPLRFISENLGCQVEWDPVLQEVKINYTNP